MPRTARRRAPSRTVGLAAAVEVFVDRVQALVAEVRRLEAENDSLRSVGAARAEKLAKQVETLKERNDALRARRAAAPRRATPTRKAAAERAPAGRGGGRRGERATDAPRRPAAAGVTGDVVRAVIGKLGTPTAAEIAAEITRAGAPVSGRAVRFIAEHAGAEPFRDAQGARRYRLG